MAEFKEGDRLRNLVTGEPVVVVSVDKKDGENFYVLCKVVKSLPTPAEDIEGHYKKEEA